MFKLSLLFFLLGVVFISDLSAYINMSAVAARAADLKMSTKDYVFAMSIAGTLSGFAFGMFLWKAR